MINIFKLRIFIAIYFSASPMNHFFGAGIFYFGDKLWHIMKGHLKQNSTSEVEKDQTKGLINNRSSAILCLFCYNKDKISHWIDQLFIETLIFKMAVMRR